MYMISNIDTICILVDLEDYQKVMYEKLEYFRQEKEKAKIGTIENGNYKHIINLNSMNFQLLTSATPGYSYIIRNNGYEIKIAQFKSKLENFYPIQVRISSEYLWAYGLWDSWSILYSWIVETFGNVRKDKVFRIDLCTHVSGMDFITEHERSYKGKYKKTEIFNTGRTINCLTFGNRKSKNIYCRIYNKSLEIQETRKKDWFKEIWKNNNLDIKNVWNVEFEIKSEFLRKYNINSIADVKNHTKDLWEYCTKEFLLKIDRTNERVERCKINSQWLELQNSYHNFNSLGLIEREKQVQMDAESLIPNIVGNITSYCAKRKNINIEQAFYNLCNDTKRYLHRKDTTFEKEVQNKLSLIQDREVKDIE